MSSPVIPICPEIPAGIRLTQFQRNLWSLLRRMVDPDRGLCHATRALAARLGVKARCVQIGLKFFRTLGLIRLVYDYGLRTRRRYVWAVPTGDAPPPATPLPAAPEATPKPNSFGAPACAQSAHAGAPTSEPPLDSPIRSLETTLERVVEVAGEEPPPLSSLAPEAAPPLAPEEVSRLQERAQSLFGRREDVAVWVVSLARRCLVWATESALEKAARKVAKGQAVRPAYVEVAARKILADGVRPLDAVASPSRSKVTAPAPAPVFARPSMAEDYDRDIARLTELLESPSTPDAIRDKIRCKLDARVAARRALDEPRA